MAPDQMHSAKQFDVRSDIWSIGVIMYQLLAGKTPFSGASVISASSVGASAVGSRFRTKEKSCRLPSLVATQSAELLASRAKSVGPG